MLNNMYWPVYKNLEKEILELSFNVYFDDMQFEYLEDGKGGFVKTPPYSLKIGDLLMRCCTEIEALIIQMTRDHNQEIRVADTNKRPIEENEKISIGCRQKWLLRHLDLDKKIVKVSCTSMFFKKSENRFFTPFSYKSGDINDFISAYNAIKHNRDELTARKGNIRFLLRSLAALFLLNVYYRNEEMIREAIWDRPSDISLDSEIFSLDIRDLTRFDENLPYATGRDYPQSVYIRKLTKDSLLEEAKEDFAENEQTYRKWKTILASATELQDYIKSGGKITRTTASVRTIVRVAGEHLVNEMNKLITFTEKVNFITSRPLFRLTKLRIPQLLKELYPDQNIDFSDERITTKNITPICVIVGASEFDICVNFRMQWEGTELLRDYEASGRKYDIENIHLASLELGKPLLAEMNKFASFADKVQFIESRSAYPMIKKNLQMALDSFFPQQNLYRDQDAITSENIEAICLLVGAQEQVQKQTDNMVEKTRLKAIKNQSKLPRRSVVILNKGQKLYDNITLPVDQLWDE